MQKTSRTEVRPAAFDCCLIGDNSLVVSCGEALRERAHRILGVISPSEAVRRWAQQSGIDWIDPREDYASLLRSRALDYLFSIVNHRKLPASVLAAPRKLAINYHDAPLPRYAGIHATAWALARGESEHGVSWHVMDETADAGDVLRTATIKIDPEETSYTLNLKCHEAAVSSFRELLVELEAGTYRPRPQERRLRTYFARHAKPTPACVMSWNMSAGALECLVRACDFGPLENTLGAAKILIGGRTVLVRSAAVCEGASREAPGTIVEISKRGLRVAAADADILLEALTDERGNALGTEVLASSMGLTPGQRLISLDDATAAEARHAFDGVYRSEAEWVERLAGTVPSNVPFRTKPTSAVDVARIQNYQRTSVELPAACRETLLELSVAFLGRVAGGSRLCISIDRTASGTVVDAVLAPRIPVDLSLENQSEVLEQLLSRIRTTLHQAQEHPGYLRDLHARYPSLRKAHGSESAARMPIAIERVRSLDAIDDRSLLDDGVVLALCITNDGSQAVWLHDPRTVRADDVECLAQQFVTFITNALAQPQGRLSDVSLMSDHERHELLVTWNETARPFPRDKCIHELIDEQVMRSPDAIAYTFGAEVLSYRELQHRSRALAARLTARGLGPGHFIGVCMNRSLSLPVALLAVLQAGAAYIPLDPTHPPSRLALMIQDSMLAALLVDESLIPSLPSCEAPMIVPDTGEPANPAPATPIARRAAPEDIAYMIYTSGSTGKPKGVPIKHFSLVNLLTSMQTTPGIDASDRILALTTISFDIACVELFLPLICGAGADILTADVATDGVRLRKTLEASNASIVQATPATWRLLLAAGWTGCKSFRIWCGGEALTPQLARQLIERCAELWNCYGPTEATVYACFEKITAADEIAIGRPVANMRAYLLDEALNPVPIGMTGELYLAGAGLSPGYHQRPDLNQKSFLSNPFATEETAARLYRTADVCRVWPDGRIEYLGRLDNQVKIRGFRIELGEIEAVLARRRDVREAVVTVAEDEQGNKRLAAYVVPVSPLQLPPTEQLRDYLHEHLPAYMVPASFAFIERVPLSPNGKVDRNSLASVAPIPQQVPSLDGHANSTEQCLFAIWSEFLKGVEFGIHDNFFDVGGDSILLVQMAQRLSREYGREITNVELFRFPTIATFAGYIAGALEPAGGHGEERTTERTSRTERRAARLQRKHALQKAH